MVKVLRIGYAPWPAAAAFLRRTAIAAAGSHARRWLADAGIAAIVTGASLFSGERIWLDNQWFYVVGILNQAVYAPDVDTSVLTGFPAAEAYLGFDGHPSTI